MATPNTKGKPVDRLEKLRRAAEAKALMECIKNAVIKHTQSCYVQQGIERACKGHTDHVVNEMTNQIENDGCPIAVSEAIRVGTQDGQDAFKFMVYDLAAIYGEEDRVAGAIADTT